MKDLFLFGVLMMILSNTEKSRVTWLYWGMGIVALIGSNFVK